MKHIFLIRREDKSPWERRVPLTPLQVQALIREGIEVHVERSPQRVFTEDLYAAVGAKIIPQGALDPDADLIMGVKEVPVTRIQPQKAYIYFSHTIKAQPYNMPMLSTLLKAQSTLFDYELITDDQGKRTVAFGLSAGYAGALEVLSLLGKKWHLKGWPNPLSDLKLPREYQSLDEAKEALRSIAKDIQVNGWPLDPLRVVIFGHGRVSHGVQEILNILPFYRCTAEEILAPPKHPLELAVLTPKEMLRPVDPKWSYSFEDFIEHPEHYEPNTREYLASATLLFNAIYWEPGYPIFVPNQWLEALALEGRLSLEIIGDISCDIHGSIEATYRACSPGDPIYTYDPIAKTWRDGLEADGLGIMAVDILPAELPRDSSLYFGNAFLPYAKDLAKIDFNAPSIEESGATPALQRACIVWKGKLRPHYQWLEAHLEAL